MTARNTRSRSPRRDSRDVGNVNEALPHAPEFVFVYRFNSFAEDAQAQSGTCTGQHVPDQNAQPHPCPRPIACNPSQCGCRCVVALMNHDIAVHNTIIDLIDDGPALSQARKSHVELTRSVLASVKELINSTEGHLVLPKVQRLLAELEDGAMKDGLQHLFERVAVAWALGWATGKPAPEVMCECH